MNEEVREELYDWKKFWQELEKISQHVDTWPEWKKQGWYILDFKEEKLSKNME